jgi:hypothetical protein
MIKYCFECGNKMKVTDYVVLSICPSCKKLVKPVRQIEYLKHQIELREQNMK